MTVLEWVSDDEVWVGIDPAISAPDTMVVLRPVHAVHAVAEHLPKLPLCWVAEGRQRGATVEDWEVSFDHQALPTYRVTDDRDSIGCRECLELVHA